MTTTYLLTSGNLLWKILYKYGHDPEPIFFEEGVRKEMLFEEEKRISLDHINKLWIKAAGLIEDPCFGLEAAGFWHPSYFGALGYAWLASTTLRKALERLDRYIHIIKVHFQGLLNGGPGCHPVHIGLILKNRHQKLI
jgi:hypothetical protein